MADAPLVLPLAHTIGTRDGTLTQDSKLVNCLVEIEGQTATILKRPGLTLTQQNPAGEAQGQCLCNGLPYAIINDTLYHTGGSESFPIPNVTVPGQFYNALSDTPTGTTLLKSRYGLWKFNGVTITQVTSAGYPAATVAGLECLDGTYYVMATDGSICGSNIQDPMTWDPLNFIAADPSYGPPVALHRHLNYLIASYEMGTQAYYDAGNATGSPLSPVSNASWTTGAASGESVVELGDELFFMATSQQRGRYIAVISGLQLQSISTPAVERVLSRDSLQEVYGFGVRTSGHSLYILTLVGINTTLVFDLASKMWSVWTSTTGSGEGYFLGTNYLNTGSQELLQGHTDGAVYSLSEAAYADVSGPISMRVVTPPFDGGSLRRKFFQACFLHSDTIDGTCQVRYSDDDYQTFSPFRTIDLASKRKQLHRLGSSRRRSWELLYTGESRLRVRGLEVEVTAGEA